MFKALNAWWSKVWYNMHSDQSKLCMWLEKANQTPDECKFTITSSGYEFTFRNFKLVKTPETHGIISYKLYSNHSTVLVLEFYLQEYNAHQETQIQRIDTLMSPENRKRVRLRAEAHEELARFIQE